MKFRQLSIKLHQDIGVILGLLIGIISLTGSSLVFGK